VIAIPMALVAFFAWGVFIYNRLVGDKNRVLSAWSDIDVQLKRRRGVHEPEHSGDGGSGW
jgi:hypothetical protein